MTIDERYQFANFLNENAYSFNKNILNEAVQGQLSDIVLEKMFELTIGKYNKIDFGDIERSRGDITKIKFDKSLNECLSTLEEMHIATNNLPAVEIIINARSNMLKMKNQFEYAFRSKNNCAIMIYNTIYYAIMEATSYLIASSINIVKEEEKETELSVTYIESKDNLLVNSLIKFNKCVENGDISKFIKASGDYINGKEVQNESISDFAAKHLTKKNLTIVLGVAAIAYMATHILPMIREIIYWIYKCRHKLSESAKMQAEFLEANIEVLKQRDGSAKIIARQARWARFFKSIANKFSLDVEKTDSDAEVDIKHDKIDVSNIVI